MSCNKSFLENPVEWMLHASQTFCRVVVFVVYVQIVVFDSSLYIRTQQVVIDKRFCGLACEFHHHSCRRVCVHIGVLASNVIVLSLDDLKKHVAGFCPAGDRPLVAICYIPFCHVLSCRLHQFYLHAILNFFDSHAVLAAHADTVGDFLNQSLIFAHFCCQHGFAYSSFYFFFVIAHNAAITFLNNLYHDYNGIVNRHVY